MPIESKYKDGIRKKEIKGLLKFLKEFSLDAGCVITEDTATEEEINGKRITFIPLWKWLLQVSTIENPLATAPKASGLPLIIRPPHTCFGGAGGRITRLLKPLPPTRS